MRLRILRRIVDVTVLPVFLVMVVYSPVALAAGDGGMRSDVIIREDEMIAASYVVWGENITEEDCAWSQSLDEGTPSFTEYNGQPACEVVFEERSVSDGIGDISVTHEDDLFVLELSQPTHPSYYEDEFSEVTFTVTFPGKVTEASGNAEISGNSVTWDLFEEHGTLSAVGGDSAGVPLPWVIGGIAGALVVAGAVVAIVLVARKKKPGAPVYPAQGYAPQGYAPQGYAQPGYAPPRHMPPGCQQSGQ